MLKRLCIAAVLLLALAAPGLAQQQPPNPSFNLINRSNVAIKEVYATSAGMTTWGRDRLGNDSIAPGQSYPVRLPADGNCIYDIKVVYTNGQTDERRALNTCNLENVTFPSGRGGGPNSGQTSNDPSFRLVNRGRSKVNEVYASLTGEDSWGQDRLGDGTVAAGGSRVIRLPTGQCVYDVRIVFANGEATEKRRLNLCNITDLRVP
ncbi:MAG TPA: hypothetical protein VE650_14975 [Acetobacteraceae bacterium]|nr:hypothetical protein [Acetobacteraceae bacterium]